MTRTMLETPATARQLRYIVDMAKTFDWQLHITDIDVRNVIIDAININADPTQLFISRDEASDAIETLIPLYRSMGTPRRGNGDGDSDSDSDGNLQNLANLLKQINAGRYALPRKSNGVVDFFEVVERDNGRRYLNQLLGGTVSSSKFHRQNLPINLQAAAARAIIIDQKAAALLYANTYHECPRCGVALTHPRSIAARIGKQCASVWGWDW